jgi:hypothetical protein
MIRKIRQALYYAHKGQGEKMNGHNRRCYITNAKGHNIMRLDWVGGREGYIVYGAESRNVTKAVRSALASVVARDLIEGQQQTKATQYAEAYSAGPASIKVVKAACIALAAGTLSACQSAGAYTALMGFVNGLLS